MSCLQGDLTPQPLPVENPLRNWSDATADDERWLVLSDAPEKVEAAQSELPKRLYAYEIPISANGALDCRVYLWHVNRCAFDTRIATILRLSENVDATAGFLDHRWQREYAFSNDPAPAGRCLAKAILFGSLDEGVPASGTLQPGVDFVLPPNGSAIQAPPSATVARLLGTVHEFRVTGTPGHVLSIRTVASATSDFGDPNVEMFLPQEPGTQTVHQRGSWPYSQLFVSVTGVAFDAAGITQSQKDRRGCGESNGPEEKKYAKRAEDTHATNGGNKALRGVICRYRVRAENTDIHHGREIAAFLRARNTNNIWQGAAYAFEEVPPSPIGRGVLPIRTSIENDEVAVRLNQTQIGIGPTTKDITVRVVHGSSGSLPVDLIYWSGPVGKPIHPPPGNEKETIE